MGICLSSESAERQESDENTVYVVGDGDDGDRARRLASLYSQQGKKGPNQDSVVLCQVFFFSFYSLSLSLIIIDGNNLL